MSCSQPSVSGIVLQEKAFEFDRLRLHDTVHNNYYDVNSF